MVSRSQLAHAALFVVGLLLLLAGFSLLGQAEYTHVAELIDESDVPDGKSPIPVESLSESDRDVVATAIDAPGEAVAVQADERIDPFHYGDASGDHYVVRGDDYYRITTAGGGVLSGADEILAWVLLAFGTLAVLAGGLDLWRHQRRSA